MTPLFKGILLLFGAWLVWLNVTSLLAKRRNLRMAKASTGWTPVTGWAVSARIVEGRSKCSESRQTIHTFRPEIDYDYNVAGQTFRGRRLAFGDVLYYDPAMAETFLAAHRDGAEITVYHDPAHPQEAVLDRNPRIATHLVFADFAMLCAGSVMLGTGLFGMLTA